MHKKSDDCFFFWLIVEFRGWMFCTKASLCLFEWFVEQSFVFGFNKNFFLNFIFYQMIILNYHLFWNSTYSLEKKEFVIANSCQICLLAQKNVFPSNCANNCQCISGKTIFFQVFEFLKKTTKVKNIVKNCLDFKTSFFWL